MLSRNFFILYCFTPLYVFGLGVEASCVPEETVCEEFRFLPELLSEELDGSIFLVSTQRAVRSAVGYCTRCEDWVEIYYPSKYCPKCGKKILDAWPLGH